MKIQAGMCYHWYLGVLEMWHVVKVGPVERYLDEPETFQNELND